MASLWTDYIALAPYAGDIHGLIGQGRSVPNDHVAFRGFNQLGLGIEAMAEPFVRLGYVPKGEYRFDAKKLFARHFEGPTPEDPKVFISELLVDELSPRAQSILRRLFAEVPLNFGQLPLMPMAGRPWNPSIEDYTTLLEESEYAAWLAAFGFRVNHFTVAVHRMPHLRGLEELNQALERAGYELNDSGGKIKGSREVGLEQSSTRAAPVKVAFADGERTIPGVYYEFAHRYVVDGTLYPGFVTRSADRIFESTDVGAGPGSPE